jgi:hypothetical protein
VKDVNSVILGGINFKSRFTVPTAEVTHRVLLPFTTFKAEFRGQPVASAKPLSLKDLTEIAVMVTKPPGSFRLKMTKLGFYRTTVTVG